MSRAEWLEQCKALLAKEKEYTRLGDRLSAEKRHLPWVKVEKDYVFDGPNGKESLGSLFGRTKGACRSRWRGFVTMTGMKNKAVVS